MTYGVANTFKDILKIISLGVLASINGPSYDAFAMDDHFSDEDHSSQNRRFDVKQVQGGLDSDEALTVALALSREENTRSRFAREFPGAAAQEEDAAFRRALELSRKEDTRSHFTPTLPPAAQDDDVDFRRALELSREENTRSRFAPSPAAPTNDDELVRALEASRIQAEEDEALSRVLRESAKDAFRPAAVASGYDALQQHGWPAAASVYNAPPQDGWLAASGYDAPQQQYGWPVAAEDGVPYQPWRPKFVESDDSENDDHFAQPQNPFTSTDLEDQNAFFERQRSKQAAGRMAIPQLGGQDDEQTPALFSNQQSIFPMKDGKFQIPDKMWPAAELANKEAFKENIKAQIDVFFAEADDDKSQYSSENDWMKQKAIPALEIKLRAQNKGAGVSRAIHEILKDIFPGLVS